MLRGHADFELDLDDALPGSKRRKIHDEFDTIGENIDLFDTSAHTANFEPHDEFSTHVTTNFPFNLTIAAALPAHAEVPIGAHDPSPLNIFDRFFVPMYQDAIKNLADDPLPQNFNLLDPRASLASNLQTLFPELSQEPISQPSQEVPEAREVVVVPAAAPVAPVDGDVDAIDIDEHNNVIIRPPGPSRDPPAVPKDRPLGAKAMVAISEIPEKLDLNELENYMGRRHNLIELRKSENVDEHGVPATCYLWFPDVVSARKAFREMANKPFKMRSHGRRHTVRCEPIIELLDVLAAAQGDSPQLTSSAGSVVDSVDNSSIVIFQHQVNPEDLVGDYSLSRKPRKSKKIKRKTKTKSTTTTTTTTTTPSTLTSSLATATATATSTATSTSTSTNTNTNTNTTTKKKKDKKQKKDKKRKQIDRNTNIIVKREKLAAEDDDFQYDEQEDYDEDEEEEAGVKFKAETAATAIEAEEDEETIEDPPPRIIVEPAPKPLPRAPTPLSDSARKENKRDKSKRSKSSSFNEEDKSSNSSKRKKKKKKNNAINDSFSSLNGSSTGGGGGAAGRKSKNSEKAASASQKSAQSQPSSPGGSSTRRRAAFKYVTNPNSKQLAAAASADSLHPLHHIWQQFNDFRNNALNTEPEGFSSRYTRQIRNYLESGISKSGFTDRKILGSLSALNKKWKNREQTGYTGKKLKADIIVFLEEMIVNMDILFGDEHAYDSDEEEENDDDQVSD